MSEADRSQVLVAVGHYAQYVSRSGCKPKGLHRWLRDGNDEQPWKEWLEPARDVEQGNVGGQPKRCQARIITPEARFGKNCNAAVVAQPGVEKPLPFCASCLPVQLHLSEALRKLREQKPIGEDEHMARECATRRNGDSRPLPGEDREPIAAARASKADCSGDFEARDE